MVTYKSAKNGHFCLTITFFKKKKQNGKNKLLKVKNSVKIMVLFWVLLRALLRPCWRPPKKWSLSVTEVSAR